MGRSASGWTGLTEGRVCEVCGHAGYCGWSDRNGVVVWRCMRSGGLEVPGWERVHRDPARARSARSQPVDLQTVTRADGTSYTFFFLDSAGGCVYKPTGAVIAPRERDPARDAAEAAEEKRKLEKKIADAQENIQRFRGADRRGVYPYLRARGLDVGALPEKKLPPAILFDAAAAYSVSVGRDANGNGVWAHLPRGPALCALIFDAVENRVVGYQRTYLDRHDPSKKRPESDRTAPRTGGGDPIVGAARMVKGAASGGACWLGPAREVGHTLVLCEGVETGLAIVASLGPHSGVMVWACISTSGLTSIKIPPGWASGGPLRRVIIAGDHDAYDPKRHGRPGAIAANLAAGRLRSMLPGVAVSVVIPAHADAPAKVGPAPGTVDAYGDCDDDGCDWLDVYTAHGPEAVHAGLKRAFKDSSAAEDTGGTPVPPASTPDSRPPTPDGGGGGSEAGVYRGPRDDGESPRVLPGVPLERARLALRELFTPKNPAGERWTIAYVTGLQSWYRWDGRRCERISEDLIAARLLDFFNGFWVFTKRGGAHQLVLAYKRAQGKTIEPDEDRFRAGDLRRAAITPAVAMSVVQAMRGECAVHADNLPVWAPPTFGPDGSPRWGVNTWPDRRQPAPTFARDDANSVFAFADGLLDIAAFRAGRWSVRPHTPRYISTTCVDYSLPADDIKAELAKDPEGVYDGGEMVAPLCPAWKKLITAVSRDDLVCEQQVQRFFGLCLTFDMSFETMLVLIGPGGSGKSTVVKGLITMLGHDAVASTSFNQLARPFGLFPLVGKPAAYIDEAQLGKSTDGTEAARWLKTLSSGMPVSVDQKHRDGVDFVKLPCRFVLTANEMWNMPDPGSALVRRMVMVPTSETFVGREDRSLEDRIASEAAGICAWALFGLRSLHREGKFVQTAEGAKKLKQFAIHCSPVRGFVEDCCTRHGGSLVAKTVLYDLYKAWCVWAGRKHYPMDVFYSQLNAVDHQIDQEVRQNPATRKRVMVVTGIRPRCEGDGDRGADGKAAEPAAVEIFDESDAWNRCGGMDFEWPVDAAAYGKHQERIGA